MDGYSDFQKQKIYSNAKGIKEIFDFINLEVKKNNKYFEEILVLVKNMVSYGKILYNILKNINNNLLDTLKISEKYIDDNMVLNQLSYKIQDINGEIEKTFGSNLGFFDINKIIGEYPFYGTDIKSNFKLDDLFIRNNISGVFSNIIMNIREHAFGNDFEGLKKLVNFIGRYDDEGNYIVEIIDNGRGMNEEELNNIFVEGKTIKEEKEGHGVGMYGQREFIRGLGGNILAESDGLGKGTKIKVIIHKNIIIEKN